MGSPAPMRGTSHRGRPRGAGWLEETAGVLGVVQLVLDVPHARCLDPWDPPVTTDKAVAPVEDRGGHARLEEVEFLLDRVFQLGQVGDHLHHLVAVGPADDRRGVDGGDDEVERLLAVLFGAVGHASDGVEFAPGGNPDAPDHIFLVVGQIMTIGHDDTLLPRAKSVMLLRPQLTSVAR